MTDAGGNKASMTYDGFDRQTLWNFPSKTTPGTVSTTDYEEYGYDALNRVTVKDIPGGSSADVYYGYDLTGAQLYARFASSAG